MKFTRTHIRDVVVIDLEPFSDSRGLFARVMCDREMAAEGLKTKFVQTNLSYNHRKGTVRGLHWQVEPFTECKLVRCTRGAVYDVIVDMRPHSPTYLQHFGVELTEKNRRLLYVPDLFAHGYQALTDDAEVTYPVSEYYTPEAERGVRWDDPAINIQWPLPVAEISSKDKAWPLLKRAMEVSA